MRTALLRKRTALIVLAAAIALCTTACFPDSAPGEPANPYVRSVYQAINQDRANAGLPALTHSPKLENLAGTWAWQMSVDNSLHHQDLSSLLYSSDYSHFSTLGENIIVGPGNMSAQALEAAWMNSAPHRANILNGSFNVVGIGVFYGPDGRVWSVVDFGAI
jgi:uncharacterized protein YkwD